MSMAMGTNEQHLEAILENVPNSNQQLTHHMSSSLAISTMIPTPGMPHGGSTNTVVSVSADSSMIPTVGAGIVARTTVNMGTLLPLANGSAGLKHNPSLNAVNGNSSFVYLYQMLFVCLGLVVIVPIVQGQVSMYTSLPMLSLGLVVEIVCYHRLA